MMSTLSIRIINLLKKKIVTLIKLISVTLILTRVDKISKFKIFLDGYCLNFLFCTKKNSDQTILRQSNATTLFFFYFLFQIKIFVCSCYCFLLSLRIGRLLHGEKLPFFLVPIYFVGVLFFLM